MSQKKLQQKKQTIREIRDQILQQSQQDTQNQQSSFASGLQQHPIKIDRKMIIFNEQNFSV